MGMPAVSTEQVERLESPQLHDHVRTISRFGPHVRAASNSPAVRSEVQRLNTSHLVKRRDPAQSAILRAWMDDYVLPAIAERILAIDTSVARRSAQLHAPDPKSERDAFIAATALVHGMNVVTRNVADFAITGVSNPESLGTRHWPSTMIGGSGHGDAEQACQRASEVR